MRLFVLLLSIAAALSAQPSVANNGILNGASFSRGQPVAPGSLVSIFGSGLAAGLAQGDSLPLSTTIGDVFVTVNGTRAPLYFASPSQINAQVPWETNSSGMATIVVNRGGAASAPAGVAMAPLAPGLFMVPGTTQAIAVNSSDGTLTAAPGSVPGLNTRAARAGEVLIVYATGLGAVTPAVRNGYDSLDALRSTVAMPVMTIGGVPARVMFSGLAPQFVGVYQLNVEVPAGVSPGPSVPMQISAGGIMHQATIAVTQ
jgi:uncharacterized protein (TIGR03437 family)